MKAQRGVDLVAEVDELADETAQEFAVIEDAGHPRDEGAMGLGLPSDAHLVADDLEEKPGGVHAMVVAPGDESNTLDELLDVDVALEINREVTMSRVPLSIRQHVGCQERVPRVNG